MRATRKAKDTEEMALQAAADELKMSPLKVLALIVKGDLIGRHVAGRTVVDRKSVEQYAEQGTKAA
jgi:hypothetical protein